jgi:hypothetical protein
MTKIDCTTCATDLEDTTTNSEMFEHGYSIRHIETWHHDGHSDSIIVWDNPAITEADLPF